MQKLPLDDCFLVVVFALLTVSGCAFAGRGNPSTKWARDHQRTALQDQEDGDEENEASELREGWIWKAREAWNAANASGQEGNSGVYVGGGNSAQHYPVAMGSMGLFKLPTSWSTVRGGVLGMDKDGIGVGGLEAGVRVHAPTRFTPYVGLSGDLGFSGLAIGYARRQTNGQNRQKVTTLAGLAAVVPEAGVSYWLNESTRLNAGASYYFAASQPDFLVFGVSLEFITGEELPFARFATAARSSNTRRSTADNSSGDPSNIQTSGRYFVVQEKVQLCLSFRVANGKNVVRIRRVMSPIPRKPCDF